MQRRAYLLRELYVLVLADPPLGELSTIVRHLVHKHATTKGPDTGKDKLMLQKLFVGWGCATHSLLQQTLFLLHENRFTIHVHLPVMLHRPPRRAANDNAELAQRTNKIYILLSPCNGTQK